MAGLIINDPYGGGQELISSGRSQIPLRETYSADPRALSAQYSDSMRNTNQLVDALSGFAKTVGNVEEQNRKIEADNAEAYVADVYGKLNSTDPIDKQLATLRPDLNPWTRAAMTQIIARQNAQGVAQAAIENMPIEARNTPEASKAYFDKVVADEGKRVGEQPFYTAPYVGALRQLFMQRSGQLSTERTTVMTQAMREDGRTQQFNAMDALIRTGQLPVDATRAPNPEEAGEVVSFAQRFSVSPLNVAMLLQTQQTQTTPDEFGATPQAVPIQQRLAQLERTLVASGIKPGATFADMYKAVNPRGNAQEDAKTFLPRAAEFLGLPMDERSTTVAGRSTSTTNVVSRDVQKILDFVSGPESGGNYNAYIGNAKNRSIDLTNMTLGEVMQFQRELVNKGAESGAVGRYQIIGKTLRGLVQEMGLDPATTKFTPELQDQMAMRLLERRGYTAWRSGKLTDDQFANNLAQEWAGVPIVTGASAGASFYAGVGSNKAGTSVSAFMDAISSARAEFGAAPTATAPNPNDPNNAPLHPDAYQLRQVFFNVDGLQDKTHPLYSRTMRKTDGIANVKQIAFQTRRPELLDAIPRSMLTPTEIEDVDKTRANIQSMRMQEWRDQKALDADAEARALEVFKNQMTTKLVQTGRIDADADARNPDGTINFERRKFLIDLQGTSSIPAEQSIRVKRDFETAIFDAATANKWDAFSTDPLLGPIIREGRQPTSAQVRAAIENRMDIGPTQKGQLIDGIDKFMQGGSLMQDPRIEKYYNDNVESMIELMLSAPAMAQRVAIKNSTLTADVKKAFSSYVRFKIEEAIRQPNGTFPEGPALTSILEQAEQRAMQRYNTIMDAVARGEKAAPAEPLTASPPQTQQPQQGQQTQQQAPSATTVPQAGEVRKGPDGSSYRFNGGDPGNRASWTKVDVAPQATQSDQATTPAPADAAPPAPPAPPEKPDLSRMTPAERSAYNRQQAREAYGSPEVGRAVQAWLQTGAKSVQSFFNTMADDINRGVEDAKVQTYIETQPSLKQEFAGFESRIQAARTKADEQRIGRELSERYEQIRSYMIDTGYMPVAPAQKKPKPYAEALSDLDSEVVIDSRFPGRDKPIVRKKDK